MTMPDAMPDAMPTDVQDAMPPQDAPGYARTDVRTDVEPSYSPESISEVRNAGARTAPGSDAWRVAHLDAGDFAMRCADRRMREGIWREHAVGWAAIAAAHYAAANVRYRPGGTR